MRNPLTRRSLVVVAGLAALGGSDALAATEDELAWLRLEQATDQLTPFWG